MKNGILNWNVDPVIYWITDTFPLQYYGILFVAGLMLGYLIVKRIYQKENIPVENLEKLSMYIFIGTFLGARLGHCLFGSFVACISFTKLSISCCKSPLKVCSVAFPNKYLWLIFSMYC